MGQTYIEDGTNKTKTISNVTDTLITKIILGTLGCVPAYDQYFVKALRRNKINGVFNLNSMKQIIQYAKDNKEEIETALNERHSPEKQKLLSAGQVTIAGLGGLGSNVAYSLARIGVGHLHLIDFDVVDITNLNRQQYFMEHIGMYKTDALKSLLLKINPYLDIRTDCVKVTEENLKELFADAQIVCEAFDNPVAKAMLVNGILEHFPEKKLVSATGMAGYESSNIISTKRMMKNFYLCGDRVTEPTYGNGLMAPRVAICAGHEANMLTRLLLGEEDV